MSAPALEFVMVDHDHASLFLGDGHCVDLTRERYHWVATLRRMSMCGGASISVDGPEEQRRRKKR